MRPFPLETGISIDFRDIADRIEGEYEHNSERNRLRVLVNRLPDPAVESTSVDARPIIQPVNSPSADPSGLPPPPSGPRSTRGSFPRATSS